MLVSCIEYLSEWIGYIRIFLSPVLMGFLAAVLLLNNFDGTGGIIIAFLLVIAGIVLGWKWASRVYKKHGTMNYLSGSTEVLNKEKD